MTTANNAQHREASMTKQEQFLWVVQTSLLAQQEPDGVTTLMLEAIKASEQLPPDKKLGEAAGEFCEWALARLHGEDDPKKPTWFARPPLAPDGQWTNENDFDVLADSKPVGSIYEDASASTPPDMRWFWSLMVTPATPGRTNDTAATREAAMAKFRVAWNSRVGE
jgi:hypothetical protein